MSRTVSSPTTLNFAICLKKENEVQYLYFACICPILLNNQWPLPLYTQRIRYSCKYFKPVILAGDLAARPVEVTDLASKNKNATTDEQGQSVCAASLRTPPVYVLHFQIKIQSTYVIIKRTWNTATWRAQKRDIGVLLVHSLPPSRGTPSAVRYNGLSSTSSSFKPYWTSFVMKVWWKSGLRVSETLAEGLLKSLHGYAPLVEEWFLWDPMTTVGIQASVHEGSRWRP